jgi:hypothetical protein
MNIYTVLCAKRNKLLGGAKLEASGKLKKGKEQPKKYPFKNQKFL